MPDEPVVDEAHVRKRIVGGDAALVAEPDVHAAPVRLELRRELVRPPRSRATGERDVAACPGKLDEQLCGPAGRFLRIGCDHELDRHPSSVVARPQPS